MDQIIESSRIQGSHRGNRLEEGERLRVLFIDDWVIGGGTKRLASGLVQKHNADSYFAVMCGTNADATGNEQLHTTVSWHDRPEEIGVNYLSSVEEDADGDQIHRQVAVPVKDEKATRNRQAIQKAAKALLSEKILAEVA